MYVITGLCLLIANTEQSLIADCLQLLNIIQQSLSQENSIANHLFIYNRRNSGISIVALSHLLTGLYYGFVAVALLINTFFYRAFRDRKIIFYLLFLATIVVSIAHSDGVLSLIANAGLRRYTEPLTHLLAVIMGGIFTIQFVNLPKQYFYNRLIFKVLVGLTVMFYVVYMASANMLFYFLGELSIAALGTFYWILALTQIKKCTESRYFLFGYTPLLFASIDFYIAQPLGLEIIHITSAHLKITSIFEMSAFLSFMIYKVSLLQKENRLYNIKIAEYVHETASDLRIADSGTEINLENFRVIYSLTDSELKVLRCITEGMNNQEISERLFISVNTVKYHIRNIYEKLDINSKSQAICKVMGQAV